jgi:predicted nucleic acid-binding protein
MPKARYWDAGPFIAWLTSETRDERAERCGPVIRAAEAGQLLIVTSSVSLIEVVKLDKKDAVVSLPPEDESKIVAFFRQPYLSVRDYDPRTAEIARGLIWKHGLSTRDAMHTATALRWKLTHMDTFDGGLLALDGVLGPPTLRITKPDLPDQLALDLPEPSDEERPPP